MKKIFSVAFLLSLGLSLTFAQQTSFPSELGLGQTWNRSLLKRVGQIKGREASWAGEKNLPLPAFNYGESPYLVAELGVEMSKGLHSAGAVTGIDREPEKDARYRAAFERIVQESGVLEAKTYDALPVLTPEELKVEKTEHETVALQAFRESIVLLKNDGNVLPVDKSKRIMMSRSYYDKKERGKVLASARQYDIITLLWDAVTAGQSETKIWLKTLSALGKPVVLILSGEESFTLDPLIESSVTAVIAGWSSQSMSKELISEVLYGSYNPGSRLTATLYDTNGKILFPMGSGLSYTVFEYSGLTLEPTETEKGKTIVVRFNVKNAGKRAGDEVALLYLQKVPTPASPAQDTRLEAFKRTHLKPGETKEVKFTIRQRNLEVIDEQMNRKVATGEYKIMIGNSGLSGTFGF